MTAISGVGTLFNRWNGSAWETIGKVTNIGGPSMSRETIDTTHLGTTGGYKTFITGLRDGGALTFNVIFERDTYDLLKADFESDVTKLYEIILPDTENTSFEINGLVTELPLTIAPDDKVSADVTIKVSGEVVVNDGSGSSTV